MRKRATLKWFVWLPVLLVPVLAAYGQKPLTAYYFEEDEVVFQFDSRMYTEATDKGSQEKLDFADLKIEKVVVSGSFNNWSRKGWMMKKVGPTTYQLRKKIEDFNDDYQLEFKFLVNGQYWAEPDERFDNRVFANEFWEEVYNLSLYDVESAPNGRLIFFLEGFGGARDVVLSGSFNGWDEHYLKMEKIEDGWEIRLDLAPGRYEYKFIVDGEWMHDPANPNQVENEHHTLNSVTYVTARVNFALPGFADAERVILAGSFNDWDEEALLMKKTDGGWDIDLDLIGGKHYYKFIVDGEWMVDPGNPFAESDGKGNVNSVLIVQ